MSAKEKFCITLFIFTESHTETLMIRSVCQESAALQYLTVMLFVTCCKFIYLYFNNISINCGALRQVLK